MTKKHILLILGVSIAFSFHCLAQGGTSLTGQQVVFKTITTAVPFLTINPDAATTGIGQASLATEGTACGYIANPAKMGFQGQKVSGAISYSPWLKDIGLGLTYLSCAAGVKLKDKHTIGGHYRTLQYPVITFTDFQGQPTGTGKPKELDLGLSYAYQISKNWSAGANLSMFHSTIAPGLVIGQPMTVTSAALGLGICYQNQIESKEIKMTYSFGYAITNIGPKVKYSLSSPKNFIPTNSGIGASARIRLFRYLMVNPAFDINKLLVPSAGGQSQVSYFKGVLLSGFDAEGGMKEEIQELMYSMGLELGGFVPFNETDQNYLKLLLRLGYFGEHETKGNRKLATIGFGGEFAYQKLQIGINYGLYLPLAQNASLSRTYVVGLSGGYNF